MRVDTLAVSETFESIQGEGPSIGMPARFLRLAGCNLTCSFCDSKYSWDGSEKGTLVEAEELAVKLAARPPTNLVITGGEPLLQQPALAVLLSLLPEDWWVEVETNGTIKPTPDLASRVSQWNVSPKLRNSGVALEKRLVERGLDFFAREDPHFAYFKFVVGRQEQILEVAALVRQYEIPAHRVYLTPEAITRDDALALSRMLAVACLEMGYHLSPRLHILLWGNQRGT